MMNTFSNDIIRTDNLSIAPACVTTGSVTKARGGALMFGILTRKKQCSECGKWKAKSEFHKSKERKDGLRRECKTCHVELTRIWRANNPEKRRAQKRRYRANNTEKAREADRQYRVNNLEKLQERDRKRYAAKPEKKREQAREWRASNPDKYREAYRKWKVENPDSRRVAEENRRARIKGNGGAITAQEWQTLKEFYDFTCLCCGRREPEIKLTLDHVTPISPPYKGSNTIDNIQPLCGSCNSKKGTRTIDYR